MKVKIKTKASAYFGKDAEVVSKIGNQITVKIGTHETTLYPGEYEITERDSNEEEKEEVKESNSSDGVKVGETVYPKGSARLGKKFPVKKDAQRFEFKKTKVKEVKRDKNGNIPFTLIRRKATKEEIKKHKEGKNK